MEHNIRIKLLMIGPLPPPLGGCTLLFEDLSQRMRERNDFTANVIDTTNRDKGSIKKTINYLGLFIGVIRNIISADVVALHTTNTKLVISGYFVWFVSFIFRKPVIIRKFGGPDHRQRVRKLQITEGLYAKIASFLLRRVDRYLAETKKAVEIAKKCRITSSFWYPNNRPIPRYTVKPPGRCKRFIYLGHVKESKGIEELIEAAEKIDIESVSVDVYGPFHDDYSESSFQGFNRVKYCGILEGQSIINTIAEYNCLVLPTYHEGEGYPGVIIEAFSAGVPVITTNWGALEELVDETCGIIIKPRNAKELKAAMIRLIENHDLYVKLANGALNKREEYSAERWAEIFAQHCKKII